MGVNFLRTKKTFVSIKLFLDWKVSKTLFSWAWWRHEVVALKYWSDFELLSNQNSKHFSVSKWCQLLPMQTFILKNALVIFHGYFRSWCPGGGQYLNHLVLHLPVALPLSGIRPIHIPKTMSWKSSQIGNWPNLYFGSLFRETHNLLAWVYSYSIMHSIEIW